MWEILSEAYRNNWLITATSNESELGDKDLHDGIVSTHAYAVLSVV